MIVWLAIPVFQWDLTAGDAGLVAEGDTLQWSYAASPAAGPGEDDPAWATVPDGTYINDADDSLRIDLPDLSGTTQPHLILEQWVAVRPGDRAVVEVDQGAGYVEVEPIGGYPSPDGFSGTDSSMASWQQVVVPMPTAAAARVRLRLEANLLLVDEGWYVRAIELVDGDVVPPEVMGVVEPQDTQDVSGPYTVEVDATDDAGISAVQLHHRVDGVLQAPIPMFEVTPGRYAADIPAPPLAPRTAIAWWAEASDGEQTGRYPPGEAIFDVFLAAPTGLRIDAEPRFVGQSVPVAWDPPESPNPVLAYELRPSEGRADCDGLGEVVVAPAPSAEWPVEADARPCLEVVARYDVPGAPADGFAGESTAPLVLDVEVPMLFDLQPDRGYPDTVQWVELSGVSLYLDPSTPPDFGPDATVALWEVLDAHRGRAQVAWPASTPPGPVDLGVVGLHGEATFPGAFTVRDAAEAPRVVSVTPDTVTQGDDVDLVVVASEGFGTDVVADGGADVFTTAPATVEGTRLVLPLSVSTRARLGERTLLVDDGVRLWTVPLTVEEYRVPIRKRCQVGPSPASVLWIVPLVGLMRRRRHLP